MSAPTQARGWHPAACRHAVPSAFVPAAGTTSGFASRACKPERCCGQIRPSRSSQRLLLDGAQILALEPAAETSCCTGLSLHCSQKRSSSVRKGLQPPPPRLLPSRGVQTQRVALSVKHLSCSPHPLPPRQECLRGTERSTKISAFCDREHPNPPILVIKNKPQPPKALAGFWSLEEGGEVEQYPSIWRGSAGKTYPVLCSLVSRAFK